MNTLHIAITLANFTTVVAAIYGFVARRPNVLAFGVVGGYLANAVALIVAIGVVAIIVAKLSSGSARGFIRRQWLGLANGAAVVASWAAFFFVGKLA